MHLNNTNMSFSSKGAETSIAMLLLVYFFMCVSGNPTTNSIVDSEIVYTIFAIALAVLLFLNKEGVVNQSFLAIAGIFSIIFLFSMTLLLQAFMFAFS